jgi:hypothetical protein
VRSTAVIRLYAHEVADTMILLGVAFSPRPPSQYLEVARRLCSSEADEMRLIMQRGTERLFE